MGDLIRGERGTALIAKDSLRVASHKSKINFQKEVKNRLDDIENKFAAQESLLLEILNMLHNIK